MTVPKRYAIITPYHKEERDVLERCLRSVQAQNLPAEHFLISDGEPQAWLDDEPVRHLKLDRNHANAGNTPRAVGALLAIAGGCDGVGFLDADNWLEPNHVALCDQAARSHPHCDYVIARRRFFRSDGSILEVEDLPIESHVDTNCFFLLPGSYHMAPYYSLMPFEFASIGDRVFYTALRARKFNAFVLAQKTVNYRTLWIGDYQRAGEIPSPEATRAIDHKWVIDWMNAKTPRERDIISRRCGLLTPLNLVNAD